MIAHLDVGPLSTNPVGLLRRIAEHGDFVRFPMGEHVCYLVNCPTQVGLVLVDNAHRLRKPEFLRRSNQGYWGDGLTTLDGPSWRERRALLRPAFRTRTIARYLDVTAEYTRQMLSTLRVGTTLRLRDELRTLVARIAARTLFDAEVEGFETVETTGQRAGVIRFEEAFGEDFTAPTDDEPELLSLTRPRAPRCMDSTVEIIDARIQSGDDRGDMLSFLLAATGADGSRLTKEEIAGELIQMLYAGHLTIPLTLCRSWYALSQHPDVARRVHQEVAELPPQFPSAGSTLPSYCERVLRETMRIYPPAPILYREVDTPFEVGEHLLEEGAAVWVSPQLLHHDPRNYPEPGRFRPERFERAHVKSIPEHAYLPFGTGPKTCIGNRLSVAQMCVIEALMAQRFRFVPRDGVVDGERFEVAPPLS